MSAFSNARHDQQHRFAHAIGSFSRSQHCSFVITDWPILSVLFCYYSQWVSWPLVDEFNTVSRMHSTHNECKWHYYYCLLSAGSCNKGKNSFSFFLHSIYALFFHHIYHVGFAVQPTHFDRNCYCIMLSFYIRTLICDIKQTPTHLSECVRTCEGRAHTYTKAEPTSTHTRTTVSSCLFSRMLWQAANTGVLPQQLLLPHQY